MNIWDELPRPFFVLAPMEGVTDYIFRQIVQQAAPADLYMSEFTNAASFCHPNGRQSTESRLKVVDGEGPVIAQIWGNQPSDFATMSQALAASNKFVGIDINLGCPVRDIVRQNACSALIGNNQVVTQLITAAKSGGLPVSVKTRIGRSTPITEEWFSFLLAQDIAAITVHGRTAKEMSKVPAHWDEIAKVVALRDKLAPQTKIIGNGDVRDRTHGLELVKETGVDGIMIGRGIFQNIFAFETKPRPHSQDELFSILRCHLQLFTESEQRTYAPLKKFFKVYVNGFPGAHELRAKLMETSTVDEALHILNNSTPEAQAK